MPLGCPPVPVTSTNTSLTKVLLGRAFVNVSTLDVLPVLVICPGVNNTLVKSTGNKSNKPTLLHGLSFKYCPEVKFSLSPERIIPSCKSFHIASFDLVKFVPYCESQYDGLYLKPNISHGCV